MPLTPEDVRNKQFTTVRLREGYDEEEVDAFLDEVETELTRLIRENDELRAKLAAATRAQAAQPQGAQRRPEQEQERTQAQQQAPQTQQQAQQAAQQQAQAQQQAAQQQAQAQQQAAQQQAQQAAQQAQQGQQQGEGGTEAAVRMLAMAQKTADDAIAEARREADRVITEARQKAEQIERDARSKAEALEREAQERHRQVMGSLEHQRDDLERRVEELRTFEREYRSRLKSYLETQLRDLEGRNASPGQPVRAGQGRGNPFAPGAAQGGDNASGQRGQEGLSASG